MDAEKAPSGDVLIKLSYEEAVVLAEMLWRWESDGTQDALVFVDHAEQRVLWDLTASFEPLIDEVFGRRYQGVVDRSRHAVRDSDD